MGKHVLVILLVLLPPLLGNAQCLSTPYQRRGITGGYSDTYLGNDKYLISINVNAYTSEPTAYQYFHRRAQQITEENGYDDYEVLDTNISSKEAWTYYSGTYYNVKKPQIYGRIRCYKKAQVPVDTLRGKSGE